MKGRTVLPLAWVILGFSISTVQASEPTPTVQPEQLTSAAWWRERAVHYADAISDADARSRAHYELANVRARAGDLAGAAKSATQIKNPQLRIFAHCFVAKQYKQKGDDGACRSCARLQGDSSGRASGRGRYASGRRQTVISCQPPFHPR